MRPRTHACYLGVKLAKGEACRKSYTVGYAQGSTNSAAFRPPVTWGCPPTPPSITHNVLSGKIQKMSQSFNNNANSLNTTVIGYKIADERFNILPWLSPLEPKLRHQGIKDIRMENIGEQLLQKEESRSWCAGSGGWEYNSAVLFCYDD